MMVLEIFQTTKVNIWNMAQQVCCSNGSPTACCVKRIGEHDEHLLSFCILQIKEMSVSAVSIPSCTAPLESKTK